LGKTDQALEDLNLMFFITDATRDEPIMISHLVRISEFRMTLQPLAEGMGKWSEPQLITLQQWLQRFDFAGDLDRTLKGERMLFGCGVIEFLRRSPDQFNALADSGSGLPGVLWMAAPGGWFDFEKLNYCRLYDLYSRSCGPPESRRISPQLTKAVDERIAAFAGKGGFVSFMKHRFFAKLLMPSLSNAFAKTAFAETGAAIAATACALERCHRASGRFPESLDALKPQFIDKIPRDLIDGQPLKYRRTAEGLYILYSIGWDAEDQDGVVSTASNRTGEGDVPKEGDWVWVPINPQHGASH